jgi:hypothetical protein
VLLALVVVLLAAPQSAPPPASTPSTTTSTTSTTSTTTPSTAPSVSLRSGSAAQVLTAAQLAAQASAVVHTLDKRDTPARGVPLADLLPLVGVDPAKKGPAEPGAKHMPLRLVLVATAADGYQAVFSVAELVVGGTTALLLFEEEGRAIGAPAGPFRLWVPTDKRTTRCVRNIVRLCVVPAAPLP